MRNAGFEIASHGYRWIDYRHVDEATERQHIAQSVAAHERLLGERPLGFYQGRTGDNSRRLCVEEGGFVYDADSYADDLPYYDRSFEPPHLVVPYTLECNDMRFAMSQGFNTSEQFFTYMKDSFDVLYAEGVTQQNDVSRLALQALRSPGKTAALARFLDYIQDHDAVWVCRRIDVARHWLAHHPPTAG